MQCRRCAAVILLFTCLTQLAVVVGVPTWNLPLISSDPFGSNPEKDTEYDQDGATPSEPIASAAQRTSLVRSFLAAGEETSGTLNPVPVEQRGYAASGNLSARTDTRTNINTSLAIDQEHGWEGSLAEVQVWNLTRLYAVNGSFDTGSPGSNTNPNGSVAYHPSSWDSISNSTNTGQTQVSSYDSGANSYTSVENQGVKTGSSGKRYIHYAGTRVLWTQNAVNLPMITQFYLSFRYLYLRGPLGSTTPGDCSIAAFVNNASVWSLKLPDVGQRGVWYSTGRVLLNLSAVGATFTLMIGLVIDEDMDLNADQGYAGGIVNTVYITAYLDDILLAGANPPGFSAVSLTFSAGAMTASISGSSGSGSASISNPAYWTADPLTVGITSNTSVSFDYEARLLSHYVSNSTWSTDIGKVGVSYETNLWSSVDVSLFTYLGSLGNYEDFLISLTVPLDWDNVTVYDPFLVNVTGQCLVTSGQVVVPQGVLSRLGWWQLRFQAPNYLNAVVTQKYDSQSGSWSNESVFRPANETRALLHIGTQESVPEDLSNGSVTWILPNGSVWADWPFSGGASGWINTSSYVIDSSAAGSWSVVVFWINGSEVAYGDAPLDVYHGATLSAVYQEIETDAGFAVTNLVRFVDSENGRYLMDDFVTIVGNWSGADTAFSPNLVKNWWEGIFDTSLVEPGTYVVRVNASRPFYDESYCLFVIRSTAATRLASPNSPWTSCAWYSTIQLIFSYEVLDAETHVWSPVMNSTGEVRVDLNWTLGRWSVSQNATSGIYEFMLDTAARPSGNWLLNVSFTKLSHQPQQMFLMLLVSPVVTTLTVYGPTSAQVDINQEHSLKVIYADSGGVPIGAANVTVDDVSPPEGLQFSPTTEVPSESGNYTLSLTPKHPGVFTVRLVAAKNGSQTATAVFVLVVNDIASTLSITTGDSAVIGFTDVYTAMFRYEMVNGSGVEDAVIAIVFSGPTGGLEWSVPVQTGAGNYSVEFSPTTSGTYLVTIAASMPYYTRSSDSFFLIVSDISSGLVSVNGTSASVLYGQSYRLVVRYTNSSGSGLDDADVGLESVNPPRALEDPTVEPLGQGNYSIVLTPKQTTTATVLISARLPNHQTAFVTFTLTTMAIPSFLTVANSTAVTTIDRSFTLYLKLQTENKVGLAGAVIAIQSPPAEVGFVDPVDMGDGFYALTMIPNEIGAFDILLRASLPNYQNASAAFTLNIVRIPTALRVAGGLSSATVGFGDTYPLLVIYERTDMMQSVADATVGVHVSPDEGPTWIIQQLNDSYIVRLVAASLGRWTITISAEKENHTQASVQFVLDILTIDTELDVGESFKTAYYGRTYQFVLTYRVLSNQSGIPSASVLVSGDGSDWISIYDLGNGSYRVNVTPVGLGDFSPLLTFDKLGYESKESRLSFTVVSIPLKVQVLSGLYAIEGVPFDVIVKVTEEDTDTPVSGAAVSFRISSDHAGDFLPMVETETPGIYSRQFVMSLWVDQTTYTLEIVVMKDTYELDGGFSTTFLKEPDFTARMTPVVATTGSLALVVLISAFGLRVIRKRRRQRNIDALSVKKRFDDISNILGIIVLHKVSGVPVYSKILRGGFEEGVISAFISAITHFRSEFGMDESHWEYEVIPISDIISAVATRNLICAFLTVAAPSVAQQVKMEAYARSCGAMFDDLLGNVQGQALDEETVKALDSLFYDLMDGDLLALYKRRWEAALPRRLKCLQATASFIERPDGFLLGELAKGMTSCGIEESYAYKLILEAIQNQFLVKAERANEAASTQLVDGKTESS
ncbi:MAG: hypothetical protein C4K49_12515 [Candidatus Thorarchaeota archaeon]|nr:MAG: hypothetical protein C4K49_12515 [Candidatus Thorarchaeota archaeon]